MISFTGINFLAIIASTIVYFTMGFVWYSLLFGELWRQETGAPKETNAKPKPAALAGQFLSTFLYVLGVALVLRLADPAGVNGIISVTLLIVIFFVLPMNSGNLLFTGKKRLFLLDVGERALGTLVIATTLTLWNG